MHLQQTVYLYMLNLLSSAEVFTFSTALLIMQTRICYAYCIGSNESLCTALRLQKARAVVTYSHSVATLWLLNARAVGGLPGDKPNDNNDSHTLFELLHS